MKMDIKFNAVWLKNSGIKYIAQYCKVSDIVIATRLLDIGKITRKQFFDYYE